MRFCGYEIVPHLIYTVLKSLPLSNHKTFIRVNNMTLRIKNIRNFIKIAKGVTAYAIKHENTKNDKVEIHTTDSDEPEATWSAETIAPEAVQ